jgi:cell shape-determining protein MreC
VKWLVLGLVGSVAAGLTAVTGTRTLTHAGFLGLSTELVSERDAAAQSLAEAQRDYHRSMIDYSSRVRWRRLGAVQRQLESQGFTCKPARVVEVIMDATQQRVRVSCGTKDGIKPGTIAVAFRGVVGMVDQVWPDMCEVVLLTDRQSGVPVAAYPPGTEPRATTRPRADAKPADRKRADAERPRGDTGEGAEAAPESQPTGPSIARGAVLGGQRPGTVILKYLDKPVVPGSEVLTSGEGSIYPPGLRVGQVIGHPSVGDRSQEAYAIVSTYVDWPSVREVVLAQRRGGRDPER